MNSKETVRTSEEGGTTTERKTNQRMKCRPTRGVVLPFLHSKFLSSGFKFVVLHTKFIIQLDKKFIVTDTKSSYSKTCFVPLKDTCQNFKPTSWKLWMQLLSNFQIMYRKLLDKKRNFRIFSRGVMSKNLVLSQHLKAHAKTLNPVLENFECGY